MKLTLVVMVGLPGSNRAGCADHMARTLPATIIATKLYRIQDPSADSQTVFARARVDMTECLRKGYNVIFDATNLSPGIRQDTLHAAWKISCQKICVWVDVPVQRAIQRSADNPESWHGPDEIRLKADRLQQMPPSLKEGFHRIFRIKPGDPYPNSL